jgi:WD40 repeat protein/transcriptional regulator with XRE-family HTH domain
MVIAQAADRADESFRGLLLRYRGRAGLTQRELVARLGASRRAVQDWEAGLNHPSAQRLQTLITVLLEAGGLTVGREALESAELWAAVLRETPRMQTPFDQVWFAGLLSAGVTPRPVPAGEGLQASEATPAEPAGAAAPGPAVERVQDWGEAPDVLDFVGRADELANLRTWVLDERCRLVAVLGIGGIGKTALTARLAQDIAPSFQRVYWRSLRDAPPSSDWLAGTIGFLSDQQLVPPTAESERLATVLQLLRQRRCLLVLDNFEALFEPGQEQGHYRDGLAGYARLLRAVGEAAHQSCLLLTSREAPPDLVPGGAIRTYRLGGLGVDEAQVLLAPKHLSGTSEQWAELTARLGGNGLALKVAGESIRELFGHDLGSFLDGGGASPIFGGVRRLLAEQVERGSAPEQQVLRVLAVEREPVSLGALLARLEPRVDRGSVLEALEALRRRSLVERAETAGATAFTLQSVVLEYVTDRLVETAGEEVRLGRPALLADQPLIVAQAKDYIRQIQERLIGAPILQRLNAQNTETRTEQRLLAVLEKWRGHPSADQGYGPGNVVNLLRLQRGQLHGLDLSCLAIRQAYLAEVDAQDASLAGAHLAETVLADAFAFPLSVALSGDGALLVVGTSTGQILLWRVADRTPLWAVQGHTGGTWSVALSTDGHVLASGGADGTVRVWEAGTGGLAATLPGHTGAIWGVALSADGHLVASGATDGTVRLWEAAPTSGEQTGESVERAPLFGHAGAAPPRAWRPMATLPGHADKIWGVALSADGQLLASGGTDGTVRLWDTAPAHGEQTIENAERPRQFGHAATAPPREWRPVATLEGHTGGVWSVKLSADGRLVGSGGMDGTVRVWETSTGRPLISLRGHSAGVRGVALDAAGRLVASGGGEGTVRLWETSTGRPLAILQGHTGGVFGLALSADGELVTTGGGEGTVRVWETSTGRPMATLPGDTGPVWGVALCADGRFVASGGGDSSVRLWETGTGRPLAILQGHTGTIRGVAVSADGRRVASGGADRTARIWDPETGRLLATLEGHTGMVWGVALSADGQLLASGGGEGDGTVRLWETGTGRLLAILQSHTGGVWDVALSADGRLVASGGEDGTVRLWEASTRRSVATLEGHTGTVRGVTLSTDGRLVASGGADGTVRLWEASTGRPVATLEGHTGGVFGVAVSIDGELIASGGGDATVRLWETSTGRPLASLNGHTGTVRGVAFAAGGQLLASGSFDGTVKLWETKSGTCLRTVRAERRYERLDITGLTGVTDAQRAALLALGAVEQR